MRFEATFDSRPLPIYAGVSALTGLSSANDPLVSLVGINIPSGRLRSAEDAINKLRTWPNNWDGYGSIAPAAEAIDKATTQLAMFYEQTLETGHPWIEPSVSASEDGEVVLEWWSGTYKLTLYVSANSIHFVNVWGRSIEREMDDGEVIGRKFEGLWRWLNA